MSEGRAGPRGGTWYPRALAVTLERWRSAAPEIKTRIDIRLHAGHPGGDGRGCCGDRDE